MRPGTPLSRCGPTTPSSLRLKSSAGLRATCPEAQIHDAWRRFVEGDGLVRSRRLVSSARPRSASTPSFAEMPDLGMARQAHACTHLTIAPTIIHGGSKINVIPDTVDLDLDIRTLPGDDEATVRAVIAEAVGRPRGQGRGALRRRRPFDGISFPDPVVGRPRPGLGELPPRRPARAFLPRRGDGCPFLPAARDGRLRLRDVLEPARLRPVLRRCSTVTTSGSTSSRSTCRRTCSSSLPATSSAEAPAAPTARPSGGSSRRVTGRGERDLSCVRPLRPPAQGRATGGTSPCCSGRSRHASSPVGRSSP